MKMRHFIMMLFVVVVAFVVWGYFTQEDRDGVWGSLSPQTTGPASQDKGDWPTGNEQIAFIELGSVKCIPCKQMQPIVEAIEKEYAGKVKVVFHDVWTEEGKKYGNEYNIRVIPTQVFLDKLGQEIFRHEGFFSKAEIEKIFKDNGVAR